MLLLLALLHASLGQPGGMMVEPKPRQGTKNGGHNKGLQHGPCGGDAVTFSEQQPKLTEGDVLNVRWNCGEVAVGGKCQITVQYPAHDPSTSLREELTYDTGTGLLN